LPESEEYAYVFVERLTNLITSIGEFVISVLLIPPTKDIAGRDLLCIEPSRTDKSNISKTTLLSDSYILPILCIVEGIFSLTKVWQLGSTLHFQGEAWNLLAWRPWQVGVWFVAAAAAIFFTVRLHVRIGELNKLDGSEQRAWSFGQMVAVSAVILTMLSSLLQCCVVHKQVVKDLGTNLL
jgi:hypothetical protein